MNEKLEKFARDDLKNGLGQLDDKHHDIFKKMYAPLVDGGRCDGIGHHQVNMPINEVVESMPIDKLDWAMEQVDLTIKRLRKG